MDSTVHVHHQLPILPESACVPGSRECSFLSRMYSLLPHGVHTSSSSHFPQVQCRCCCSVTQACVSFVIVDSILPGCSVLHCLPEFAQTQVHWVNDAIQPSHPLSPSSPLSFPASGSFPLVSSLHHVVKLLQLQLQHQSYQLIHSGLISFRIHGFDLLAVQGPLKSLPQHHSLKAYSSVLGLLYVQLSHPYMPTRKP